MHCAESLGEPGRKGEYGEQRQGPVLPDRVGQRRPVDVVGDQPRYRRVRVSVDNWRGERAADTARRLDFPCEPQPETSILCQVRTDDLDRHVAPAGRSTEIDLAHAAGP
jgi:hypothetical protein